MAINNLEDNIADLLSTSLSAFNAIANNQWLEVTKAEYDLIATKLSAITIGGLKDADFANSTSFTDNYTQSMLTSTDNSVIIDTIPAQSYIMAFKFISRDNSNSGIKLKASTNSLNTGFNDVGNSIDISNSFNGKTHYFINKSSKVVTSKAFLAIYTGSADLGGIASSVARRYYFSGEATPSTTLDGPISGNMPSFQTLNTTLKQW